MQNTLSYTSNKPNFSNKVSNEKSYTQQMEMIYINKILQLAPTPGIAFER